MSTTNILARKSEQCKLLQCKTGAELEGFDPLDLLVSNWEELRVTGIDPDKCLSSVVSSALLFHVQQKVMYGHTSLHALNKHVQ